MVLFLLSPMSYRSPYFSHCGPRSGLVNPPYFFLPPGFLYATCCDLSINKSTFPSNEKLSAAVQNLTLPLLVPFIYFDTITINTTIIYSWKQCCCCCCCCSISLIGISISKYLQMSARWKLHNNVTKSFNMQRIPDWSQFQYMMRMRMERCTRCFGVVSFHNFGSKSVISRLSPIVTHQMRQTTSTAVVLETCRTWARSTDYWREKSSLYK